MNSSNIAIVIPSCDNYSDVWETYFNSLSKFWPHGLNIYLICNFKKFHYSGVNVINVGKDSTWSNNLIIALNLIEEDYIFLIIEDLIFTSKVNIENINFLFNRFKSENFNYLSFINNTKTRNRFDYLHHIPICTPYRVSTQFTLWKKNILLSILAPNENAWEFEVNGTIRSASIGNWFRTNNTMFNFINLIVKGKINKSASNKLINLGLYYNSNRGYMSFSSKVVIFFKNYLSKYLNYLLPKLYFKIWKFQKLKK